ncbi:tyrosine-type recombinase/integrase [Pseudomonas lurida]|uniref:Tyrosine-type recombinase/integrase n=1 Tax=Pseudomonas lurida TaxID=244566 RepID=A0ABY9FLR1_9PSED|nr:tyrosine-type recombinase/integrase [Pseudomonas lurida]MBD8666574.1 tyrosine-type recombinase/integrase [Pseudomonas lurida]UZQ74593.1 tyrosine-type recombinase/integrase [Pseudomonas lurida]WLG26041.1 tyrosine-type recombinase/integrase [Pseudomonas lurida]WLH04252.1 tyrosine-type recombinase/integrase [Pseudomonas lurida]
MRRKNSANLDLPPRMLRRSATLKSGRIWIGYYYNGRDADGKRKEIPLGGDLDQAKVEWARLERKAPPKPSHLLGALFDRYVKEIIPKKGVRTQSDNMKELKQLRKAFEQAPIDSITPQVIAQYRDARTAKVRANREIALLSHMFTIAREWGLTSNANPCFGVRRNKEKPRDYYAGDIVWNAVYTEAVQELKDAMDLAYLTGQRPADVLKVATTDLNAGFLVVKQGKTEKKLRLRLEDAGVQSALSTFINDLQERRALAGIKTSRLITNTSGLRMSQQMLRNRWDEAREKAAIKAGADGDSSLAVLIRQFQFKDIRPKAASEIELAHASRLLGHSTEEMTKKVYRRVGEIVKPTK